MPQELIKTALTLKCTRDWRLMGNTQEAGHQEAETETMTHNDVEPRTSLTVLRSSTAEMNKHKKRYRVLLKELNNLAVTHHITT